MHFLINNKANQKIREFLQTNINTNVLPDKKEEILIRCKNKELLFYSNNGFTECKLIFESSEIKYKKQGEIILNSKILLSLLDNLKNYIEIEFQKIENSLLKVNSEKFECNLVCLNKKFPLQLEFMNDLYEKITFEFNFLSLINSKFRDFYKTSTGNIQKNTVFNTINFKKDTSSKKINVLITDSYKILFASFITDNYLENKSFEFNLSPEMLNSIIVLFKDRYFSKKINFHIDKENLVVTSENLTFKTKLYVGSYPNLVDLFFAEEKINFSINRNLLISAIERNLLLSDQNLNITLYKTSGENLILEYKDNSKGFSKEEIEIKKNKGEDIQFSLNSLFLKQLLRNISDTDVIFSISEPFKPIVLFGKEEGENFKQIIVPLKYS